MKILNVLGILYLFSSARSETLDAFDFSTFYEYVENIENTFGKSLTEKLINAAYEVVTGSFTRERAKEFLAELTSAEKDRAAEGVITVVHELGKIASAPGAKTRIKMGLEIAPIVIQQLLNSARPGTPPTEKPQKTNVKPEGESEQRKDENSVVKLEPNLTDGVEDLIAAELVGRLKRSGSSPDELLEILEQILEILSVDELKDRAGSKVERLAIGDGTAEATGEGGKVEKKTTNKSEKDEL